MKWKTEYLVLPHTTTTNDPGWAAQHLTDRLNKHAAQGWSVDPTIQVSGAVVFVKRTRITDDDRVDEIMANSLETEIVGTLDITATRYDDLSGDETKQQLAGDDAIRYIVRRALEEDWR